VTSISLRCRLGRLGFCCLVLVIASVGAGDAPSAAKKAPDKGSTRGAASAGGPGAASPVTSAHLRALSWRSIGPANMGGRISEIVLVPGKGHQFLVATATGGVFKTVNDGTTFTPLFDKQPVLSTGSIVIAPSDTKILYVGTGEGNGRNSSSWGNGVYKSTDGGETFAPVGLPDSRDIPRLAIHPKNPDILYAAAMGHLWDANKERGLFKTTDGGKSWNAALQIDENHGCIDVALDPGDPETVYAAMYARRRRPWSFESGGFGDKGGIYKSVDGGRTFRRLTSGLPTRTGRIGLATDAKRPGRLYAVIEADDAGAQPIFSVVSKAGGIFRSADGGGTWERMSSLNPRPFYFSKIVLDPEDEMRVYVLGFGLAVSDDAGRTFRPNGARLPHGDMHTLVIDPADHEHLLMGTDGGIYESHDRAATWRYLDNIPLGQFYEVGLGMDAPYTVCGGLQDNGSWCGPSLGRAVFGENREKASHISNQDWRFIWGGDGYYVRLDPRDPNIVYAEAQEGWIGRTNLTTGQQKILRPEQKEGSANFRFNWDSPIALSHHDPETLYLGGNHLFKLTRRGEAWETISPDLSTRDVEKVLTVGSGAETHGTVVALSESPLRAGLIWIGTDDGRVQLTRDDGETWEDLTAKLPAPKNTYVSRIDASPFDPAAATVAFDGHRTGDNRPTIVETRDFGASWRSLAGDLPADGPVRGLRADPVNPDLLFVGTEFGVFATLDHGEHWVSLRGESLPAVAVHDLQIHPREKDLVIGTHGRSIYIMDDITGLEHLTPENRAKPVVLFPPRAATGFYLLERGGMWGDDQFAAKNPPLGASFNYWVKERHPDGAKLEIKDSKGLKVREIIKAPAEAGLNRANWDLTREKEERIDPPEVEWPGQTPFVAAGTYEVTLTVGKETSKAKLTVSYPPGVGPEPFAP
jgi:photosystem II stability/assembly factor-like uncharacterized protein